MRTSSRLMCLVIAMLASGPASAPAPDASSSEGRFRPGAGTISHDISSRPRRSWTFRNADGPQPASTQRVTAGATASPGLPGSWWDGFGGGVVGSAVLTFCPFSEGLVIGGDVQGVAGTEAAGLGFWDGKQWQALGAGLGQGYGIVYALVVYRGQLVAGGHFAVSGTDSVANIAVWDGSRWLPLGGGVNDEVYALAVRDDLLYVGGTFTRAGQLDARYVSAWDGQAWRRLGDGMDDWVMSLAVTPEGVVAGGWFTAAGGGPANHVAIWEGEGWSALGDGTPGQVNALAMTPVGLVAGGSDYPIQTAHVHRWVDGAWEQLGEAFDSEIWTVNFVSGALMVSGRFTMVGGESVKMIATWDGQRWNELGGGIGSGVGVFATVEYGGRPVMGGSFYSAGGHGCYTLALWNGSDWCAFGNSPSSGVRALLPWHDGVVVGGSFDTAGDRVCDRVALWTPDGWQPIGRGLPGEVRALGTYQSQLVAGGEFAADSLGAPSHVAVWRGDAWCDLGGGTDAPVYAAVEYEGMLVVGGEFTVAGGQSAAHIAAWDGSTWRAMGTGMERTVYALCVHAGALYAGGDFSTAGGLPAAYVAKWDGVGWQPVGGGVGNYVRALCSHGDLLAAGGWFGLGIWNGVRWTGLGPFGNFYEIDALLSYGGLLYAGGYFDTVAGLTVNNICAWDGAAWAAMDGGITRYFAFPGVFALAGSDLGVFAGGAFWAAGTVNSSNIARWVSRPTGVSESLRARRRGDEVVVNWEVGPEPRGAGVRVWVRGESGDRVQLTASPLAFATSDEFVDRRPPETACDYWVELVYAGDSSRWLGPAPVGAGPRRNLTLAVSGPNPTRTGAVVRFAIPAGGPVRVSVYDLQGRLIRELLRSDLLSGQHSLEWDGRGERGKRAASGVYLVRLVTEQGVRSGKMTLAK